MKSQNKKGFTLIEILIAISMVSVILTSLYVSVQSGLAAYIKNESHLNYNWEKDVTLHQLTADLLGTIPYSKQAFTGTSNAIEFPARLRQYTPKGVTEGLYVVKYQVRNNTLVRSERPLSESSLKKTHTTEESLLKDLSAQSGFKFLYMKVEKDQEIFKWEKSWSNKPYVGLPSGIRVFLKDIQSDGVTTQRDILIPHGMIVAPV
jgi:prepilin-type N-terminal cleavage/methylation domain-containing protein